MSIQLNFKGCHSRAFNACEPSAKPKIELISRQVLGTIIAIATKTS